jgi:hypothetical protein
MFQIFQNLQIHYLSELCGIPYELATFHRTFFSLSLGLPYFRGLAARFICSQHYGNPSGSQSVRHYPPNLHNLTVKSSLPTTRHPHSPATLWSLPPQTDIPNIHLLSRDLPHSHQCLDMRAVLARQGTVAHCGQLAGQ